MQARILSRRTAGWCAGAMALAAYYGSVGLISGLIPVDGRLEERLPFHSGTFAGLALAVVVAFPMSSAAVLGWRRRPITGAVTALAGAILVGWIGIEFAIIRMYSPLQPICVAAGVGLVLLGLKLAPSATDGDRGPASHADTARPARTR